MKKKAYIKPELDIVLVATQQFNLPSSPGGSTPSIGGIKADPFDEVEDLTDFDSEINGLLW